MDGSCGKDFEFSLWGMFLAPPWVSLKRMLWKVFEVSVWGMTLVPRVGSFERDVVEGC